MYKYHNKLFHTTLVYKTKQFYGLTYILEIIFYMGDIKSAFGCGKFSSFPSKMKIYKTRLVHSVSKKMMIFCFLTSV